MAVYTVIVAEQSEDCFITLGVPFCEVIPIAEVPQWIEDHEAEGSPTHSRTEARFRGALLRHRLAATAQIRREGSDPELQILRSGRNLHVVNEAG